jgi:iron complex outermembrane recepter protein
MHFSSAIARSTRTTADLVTSAVVLCYIAVAAMPGAASAEEPQPAAQRVQQQIEEIVVTAQKKAEDIEQVPISMLAFRGQFLTEAGIEKLHQLASYSPNVRLTGNEFGPTVFIRGFGTPFAGSAFEPAVGFAVDELSIPREIYMADPLYDIERVEVLRGPQGTLFGKNTPAGLFNVTTRAPTDEFGGDVVAWAGGLGVHHEEAGVGGALSDVARFRLAAVDLEQAADVHNTKLDVGEPATGQRAVRLKLDVRPLDGLDVLLIGSGAFTNARFSNLQNYLMRDSSVRFLRQYDPKFEDDGFDHQDSINLKKDLHRETGSVQGNFHYALGDLLGMRDANLVAILGDTGFNQTAGVDEDASPADIANLTFHFRYQQRSAELRASGLLPGPFRIGEIEPLIGALFFDAHLLSNAPLRAGKDLGAFVLSAPGFELITKRQAPGGVGFTDLTQATARLGIDPIGDAHLLEGDGGRFLLDQDLDSKAVFGQVAWHLTERWTASFGGRFTYEAKKAHLLNQCFQPGVVCAALGIEQFDLQRSRSETDFAPKVTLQYFPLSNLSLFATRGEGFKSGGFNNFSFTRTGIEVEPEKTVSWEVGAKGSLFDERLAYSAAFFDMEAKDLQVQNLVGTIVVVRNAASARSRGVEMDLRWLSPWQALSVTGAGALTDARFKDFRNAPATASSGSNTQDLSGRRMPFVPETQLALTPRLDFPIHAALSRDVVFTTALDVLYRSSAYLDSDLDPKKRQPGYAILNARIGLTDSAERLSLIAAVTNLANTDSAEYITNSIVFPGGYMVRQEFQRNYEVQLRYSW